MSLEMIVFGVKEEAHILNGGLFGMCLSGVTLCT